MSRTGPNRSPAVVWCIKGTASLASRTAGWGRRSSSIRSRTGNNVFFGSSSGVFDDIRIFMTSRPRRCQRLAARAFGLSGRGSSCGRGGCGRVDPREDLVHPYGGVQDNCQIRGRENAKRYGHRPLPSARRCGGEGERGRRADVGSCTGLDVCKSASVTRVCSLGGGGARFRRRGCLLRWIPACRPRLSGWAFSRPESDGCRPGCCGEG